MKKYLNIFMLAAATILLIACDRNASKETVPTKQFSIVKANLGIAPGGGECTIEVKAAQSVTAAPERDWCTASVSGSIITVTASANLTNESRYCRIRLQSGKEVLYATVQQYGEVIDGLEGLSDVTAPVAGRKIEVAVKSNVALEVTTAETWIHPSYENGILTIDVEKNDEPRTRFGTVQYFAGSVSGSFEVTQYPELVKPDSWVITEGAPSFAYPKFNTSASLSAGAEDMYVMCLIPKSKVEGNVDDWIFDNLAVQTRNEILGQIEAHPETTFKDYLTTGTDAITFEDIQTGENYVMAIGFADNSYVSGRYQYKLITIDDIRPAYYKWAGKWKITGKTNPFGTLTFTGEEQWTISVDENNLEKELFVRGINSITHASVLAADGDAMKLVYDAEDGSISLSSQKGAGFEYSTYGVSHMHPQGMYSKNGTSTTRVSSIGALIFKATRADDGTVTITPGTRVSSGTTYTYFGFRLYLDGGDGSTYTLNASYQSGVIPLPFEMSPAE